MAFFAFVIFPWKMHWKYGENKEKIYFENLYVCKLKNVFITDLNFYQEEANLFYFYMLTFLESGCIKNLKTPR